MQHQTSRKTPSYEEIIERFGDKVSLNEALEKTSAIQDCYPELTGFGSIIASPHTYGEIEMRQTSRGLDFIGPEDSVKELLEDYSENWSYNGSYVASTDGEFQDEWMIAAVPCGKNIFEDEVLNSFNIDYDRLKDSRELATPYGDVTLISPELGFASKLRRYVMQKHNRSNFKQSDLLDISNMLLNPDIIENGDASKFINDYIGTEIDSNNLMNDICNILDGQGLIDDQVSDEDIETILRETRKIVD